MHCTSKDASVIAFIARCIRDYPVRRAGVQRAVSGDAGCVQKCVCAQRRLAGHGHTSYRLCTAGTSSDVTVRALHLLHLGGAWVPISGGLLTFKTLSSDFLGSRKFNFTGADRVDVEP